MQLTAIIQPDSLTSGGTIYTATCPELDIVSQGESKSEARLNLQEAVQLFLETADNAEIGRRLREGATVSTLEVAA